MNDATSPGRRISNIILHIGAHKTGSTYLQQYLHDNRDALLQHGIYYPHLPDNPYIQQHSSLALALREEDKRPAVKALEKLAESARTIDAETMLLSGEELFFATGDEISLLRASLESRLECEFRVVVYIRNTYDYIRSTFNQHLRFENYSFNESQLLALMEMYTPSDILRRWESVFGTAAVEVFSYDRHKSRLLDHFLDAIEAPRLEDRVNIPKLMTNPSIDFLSAFVLNQVLFDRSLDLKHQVYSQIVEETDSWKDLHYGSEIAVIESILARMQIDLDHPKLQPLEPSLSAIPDRSLATGHGKESILRLMHALDVVLANLDEAERVARRAARIAAEAAAAEARMAVEAEVVLKAETAACATED